MKVTLLVFALCMTTVLVNAYPSRLALIHNRDDKPAPSQVQEEQEYEDDFITLKLPKSWAKQYLGDLLQHYFERRLDDARLYHDDELNKEFIARSTLKAFGGLRKKKKKKKPQ